VGFDPLAATRTADGGRFDLFVYGTVFLDIVFTGLAQPPGAGTEVWAEGMGSCPGGIANLAIAASRLGLRTSLAAAFSSDDYGDFCWRTLAEQEGVDLSRSRRFEGWHSPVTV
jgi:sugar/nucleoside kinase (ribokinase family)